jgi:hypothetical protein
VLQEISIRGYLGFWESVRERLLCNHKKKILECIDRHQEAVSLFNAGPPHVSKNAAIAKPSDAFAMEIFGMKKPKLDPRFLLYILQGCGMRDRVHVNSGKLALRQ